VRKWGKPDEEEKPPLPEPVIDVDEEGRTIKRYPPMYAAPSQQPFTARPISRRGRSE
jgi:hypothetical protein